MRKKNIQLYHYTLQWNVGSIFQSEKLKVFPRSHHHPNENNFLWFSKNNHFENSIRSIDFDFGTNGLFFLNMEQMAQAHGLIRFGFKLKRSRVVRWRRILRRSTLKIEDYNRISNTGREVGANPNEWYISLTDIPLRQANSIEIFRDGEWVPYFD